MEERLADRAQGPHTAAVARLRALRKDKGKGGSDGASTYMYMPCCIRGSSEMLLASSMRILVAVGRGKGRKGQRGRNGACSLRSRVVLVPRAYRVLSESSRSEQVARCSSSAQWPRIGAVGCTRARLCTLSAPHGHRPFCRVALFVWRCMFACSWFSCGPRVSRVSSVRSVRSVRSAWRLSTRTTLATTVSP